MNIFEDIAPKLYERGLPVIPIDKGFKRPPRGPHVSNWSRFCKLLPTEKEFDNLVKHHGDLGIGLCLGPASKIIALDFDYMGPEKEYYEKKVREIIGYSPIEKRGHPEKFTAFYKYNPDLVARKLKWNRSDTVIEILTEGNQTVLPPTIHPDTNKQYYYTTKDDLENSDLDILPNISLDQINKLELLANEIKSKYGEMNLSTGRNDKLKSMVIAALSSGDDEQTIINSIVKYDNNFETPLFSDAQEGYRVKSDEDIIKNATKFVRSITKSVSGIELKPYENKNNDDSNNSKKAKIDYNSFEVFFKKVIDVKKDILSLNGMYLDDNGTWQAIKNYLPMLRSLCVDYKLARTYCEDHLYRYVDSLKQQLLINIPEWDGKDRIKEVSSHIKIKNVSNEVFEDLFKEWAANIFRRLEDPMNQNKLVIFKGDQGKGKDHLIHQLLSGFDIYYSNILINKKETENYLVMSKRLVLNISEYDQVHRLNSAVLKDLITKDSAEMRKPYGHDSIEMQFRCSFIASCNPEEILTDPTGNRRFMIFEIDEIDWSYPKEQGTQLLAQYHHLYKTAYKASDHSVSIMDQYIGDHTPIDINSVILEMYLNRFENIYKSKGLPSIKAIPFSDMELAIEDIGRISGKGTRYVLSFLKTKGLSKHRSGGTFYYKSITDSSRSIFSIRRESSIGEDNDQFVKKIDHAITDRSLS